MYFFLDYIMSEIAITYSLSDWHFKFLLTFQYLWNGKQWEYYSQSAQKFEKDPVILKMMHSHILSLK